MPIRVRRKDCVWQRNYRLARDVEGAAVDGAGLPHGHFHLLGVYRPVGRALLASAGCKESFCYLVGLALELGDLLAFEMVDVFLRQHLGVVEHHRLVGDVDRRLGRPHFDFRIDQVNMPHRAGLTLAAHNVDLVGLQHAAALGHDGVALYHEGVGLGVVDRFLAGDIYRLFVLGANRAWNRGRLRFRGRCGGRRISVGDSRRERRGHHP